MTLRFRFTALAIAALGVHATVPASAQQQQEATQKAFCPTFGWAEGLVKNFQQPNSPFPVNDTKPNPAKPNDPIPDCNFHMWSYEAFVWATALDSNGVPRFMMLPMEDDLLSADANAAAVRPRALKLGARSTMSHATPGYTEGAGAFVEADGNVLVAPNGYPVYGSVHLNPSYFATAKQNLIVNGGYQSHPASPSRSARGVQGDLAAGSPPARSAGGARHPGPGPGAHRAA